MDISDDADQCPNPAAVDTIIRCNVCDRNLTGIKDVHGVDKDELGLRIEGGLLKSTSPRLTFKIPLVDHQVKHYSKHFSFSFGSIFCLQGQINTPKKSKLVLSSVEP